MSPIDLAFQRFVPSERECRPPLIIAHGLFGASTNWRTIARNLATGRQVIAVDMRNHGKSPWEASHNYPELAGDLERLIAREAGGNATLMGHSMGGKAAMWLALSAPSLISELIVVDIAPAFRRNENAALIARMRAIDPDALTHRSALDALLAPAEPDRAVRAFLAQNLVFAQDKARWRVNLNALAAEAAALAGFPDPPEGAAFSGPSLFLHGGRSDYVGPGHVPAIHALFPRAQILCMAHCGHWPHTESPKAFLAHVRAFLSCGEDSFFND